MKPVMISTAAAVAPKLEEFRPTAPVSVDLVRRAQAGERAAFAEVFEISARSVSRYVGAILGDSTRTEDVVAQTYLDVWKQLPRLREPERFSAWILRVAHNRAIDELRRPVAQPIDEAPELTSPADAEPEEALLRQADVDQVREVLLQLPADHREVVALRYLQGLSHAEVARQMGRSEEASRALLHRALRRMRRLMESK